MNEDLKPILDIEADWVPRQRSGEKRFIYENVRHPGLFRIIDMSASSIIFSDINRVEKITDINKVLAKEDDKEKNARRYKSLINRVLDEVHPISMPYVPEHMNAYIEAFPGFNETEDDTVGILYFWNKPDEKVLDDAGGELEAEMIPAKRFFRVHPVGAGVRFEEIDFMTYNDRKGKWMNREEEKLNGRK